MQYSKLEKGLIKFTHCQKDIYCCSVPQHCPICGQSAVSSWKLEDAPVSIPSPFVNGHGEQFSFVLKPTKGLFISEYDGCSDLHVGITSSQGVVFNYNETGVHRDATGWDQCVSVLLVPPDVHNVRSQWDDYLERFSAADRWLPQRYEESDHNCYTFALTFVNSMLTLQEKKTFSKKEFTERFVLPRTRRASKYITICKEISENDFYIVKNHKNVVITP
ncbi:MKRN2 opposite strand protein-like [Bombina bombina]|uniref:MKRN2 opposite strand protein-like n=1 Tax=Bombina bombina TaxID=8345 RepID=UPI00235B236A|nr:MKRN2 opposite strand protein-like [Bombina bombina]